MADANQILAEWMNSAGVDGYRNSMVSYLGDGSTTTFEFNFAGGYIAPEHVRAYVFDTATGLVTEIEAPVLSGPNTLYVSPALGTTQTLVIYRDTPKGSPLVDFSTGAPMTEDNLDLITKQAIFGAAELVDRFDSTRSSSETATATATEALIRAAAAEGAAVQASADAGAAQTSASAAQASASAAAADAASAAALADSADSKATTALSTANAASSAASSATSTANTAKSTADTAKATADAATTAAGTAVSTANAASTAAGSATSTANTAKSTADSASTKAQQALDYVSSGASTSAANNFTQVNTFPQVKLTTPASQSDHPVRLVEAEAAISAASPSGAVVMFARSTPPTGWLKANGGAVSRPAYAALFAAIGTTFGAGDGATTFNVPDLRGAFMRGWDDGRGLDAGRTFGAYQDFANAWHAHGVSDPGHAHPVGDPGHAHGAWTDTQGWHGHDFNMMPNNQGYGLIASGGFVNEAVVNRFGSGTNGAGNHGHNVGVSASGTGIWIGGAGTGIAIQGDGAAEARPRNYALLACIKF